MGFRLDRDITIGVLGQGLAALSVIVPTAIGSGAQIKALVGVSAGASIVAYLCAGAAPQIVPTLSSYRAVGAALLYSAGVLSISLLITIGAVASSLLSPEFHPTVFAWLSASASLTATQACYLLGTSGLVRVGDFHAVAVIRVVYGAVCVGAMTFVVLVSQDRFAMCYANSVAFFFSSIYCLVRLRRFVPRLWRSLSVGGACAGLGYGWRHRRVLLSSVLDGVGSQGPALAVVGGSSSILSELWSIIARIGGGMATVALNVVAPRFDIQFSRARRSENADEMLRVNRQASIAGVALGLVTTFVSVAAMIILVDLSNVSARVVLGIGLAALGVWGGSIAFALIQKNMVMAGNERIRLVWSGLRAAVVLLILSFDFGLRTLVLLSISSVMMFGLYSWLTVRTITRM